MENLRELEELGSPQQIENIIENKSYVKYLWIIISIFSIMVILFSVLYLVSAWPYNIFYIPVNPRNNEPIPIIESNDGEKIYGNDNWLKRDFDYAPYYVTEPDPNVKCSYYNLITNYCNKYCINNQCNDICNDENLPTPLRSNGNILPFGCPNP